MFDTSHSFHCFDALRQYVMCTAGDTPLYTWGRNITGDGQQRRCRSWAMLSSWATEHTACFMDGDGPMPLYKHFGHCDDGLDGLMNDRAF